MPSSGAESSQDTISRRRRATNRPPDFGRVRSSRAARGHVRQPPAHGLLKLALHERRAVGLTARLPVGHGRPLPWFAARTIRIVGHVDGRGGSRALRCVFSFTTRRSCHWRVKPRCGSIGSPSAHDAVSRPPEFLRTKESTREPRGGRHGRERHARARARAAALAPARARRGGREPARSASRSLACR